MAEVVRRVVFSACAAFILLAPAYTKYGKKVPAYAVRWDMFGHTGTDIYEVRFDTLDERGQRVVLDRFALLGYPDPFQAPRPTRLFKQESEAWSVAQSLCNALGPDKPVFMTLRDATLRGWKVVEDGSKDVCKRNAPTSSTVRASDGHDDGDLVP